MKSDFRKTEENGEVTHIHQFHYDRNGNVTEYYAGAPDTLELQAFCTYRNDGTRLTYDNIEFDFSYTYDAKGNVRTECIDGRTTVYTYNQEDQIIIKEDGRSNSTTHYTYDKKGNVATEKLVVKGEVRYETIHTYDIMGNHRSEKLYQSGQPYDGRISREWEYDTRGNLTEERNYLGAKLSKRRTYTYDKAGNKLSYLSINLETGRVEATYWEYNKDGLVTAEATANGTKDDLSPRKIKYTYTYDNRGNLIEKRYKPATEQEKVTAWTYDDADNITSEVRTSPEGRNSFEWTYDKAGNKLSETYIGTNSSYKIAWTYDAEGRVLTETHSHITNTSRAYQIRYNYDEGGRLILSETEHANGTITRCVYTFSAIWVPAQFAERLQKEQEEAVHHVDTTYLTMY